MPLRTASLRLALPTATLLAGLALVAGCGGSAGEGPVDDRPPAAVRVSFPPPVAITESGAVTVRGTFDDGRPPRRVLVNDVRARVGASGADWQATVPLARGVNAIVVEAVDADGAHREVARRALRSEILADGVGDAIVDALRDRALVPRVAGLVSVDLASGATAEVGSVAGVALGGPAVLDARRQRLYHVEGSTRETFGLVAHDLTSGERGASLGRFFYYGPIDLALDPAGDHLYVTQTDHLVEVDLGSGETRSLGLREADDALAIADSVAISPDGATAVVLGWEGFGGDLTEEGWWLAAVDLASGAAVRVSGAGLGEGPPLGPGIDLALDAAGERAFVLTNAERPRVVEVDLASGVRRIVSDASHGSGPELARPAALARDGRRGELLVADAARGLVRIEPGSGDREMRVDLRVGAGPAWGRPVAVRLEDPARAVLVADARTRSVVEVTLATGERRTLSSDEVGEGAPLRGPVDLDLANRVRVAVLDGDPARLVLVERNGGDRRVVSGDGVGTGEPFVRAVAVAFEPGRERALVVDRELPGLVAVDAVSGARAVLSSVEPTLGPAFTVPTDIALDPVRDRALVLDLDGPERTEIVAVDLATGARRVFADLSRLEGAYVDEGARLAMDERGERLLVGSGALVAIDLASGTVTVPGFAEREPNLYAFAFEPATRTAIEPRDGGAELAVVDMVTGERVVVSR